MPHVSRPSANGPASRARPTRATAAAAPMIPPRPAADVNAPTSVAPAPTRSIATTMTSTSRAPSMNAAAAISDDDRPRAASCRRGTGGRANDLRRSRTRRPGSAARRSRSGSSRRARRRASTPAAQTRNTAPAPDAVEDEAGGERRDGDARCSGPCPTRRWPRSARPASAPATAGSRRGPARQRDRHRGERGERDRRRPPERRRRARRRRRPSRSPGRRTRRAAARSRRNRPPSDAAIGAMIAAGASIAKATRPDSVAPPRSNA